METFGITYISYRKVFNLEFSISLLSISLVIDKLISCVWCSVKNNYFSILLCKDRLHHCQLSLEAIVVSDLINAYKSGRSAEICCKSSRSQTEFSRLFLTISRDPYSEFKLKTSVWIIVWKYLVYALKASFTLSVVKRPNKSLLKEKIGLNSCFP